MLRRDALGLILAALASACARGARAPAPPPAPPPPPLPVGAATDLAAAAGLVWMVDLRLREIFASADLIPAIGLLLPEARLDRFAAANGGVDLRQMLELCIATYRDATLVVARGMFDEARLSKAFEDRADQIDGRAEDAATLPDGRVAAPVTRLWGTARGAREQLALFSREAFAFERGRFGALKAAELFAQGKLKRAKPTLAASPLDSVAALLGDAPARAFAPGPFAGDLARGLGGLLAATLAAGVAARPSAAAAGGVYAKVVLTGAWEQNASEAAIRLASEYDKLAEDTLGHLCGLGRPLVPAKASGTNDAITLEVTLDAAEIARGLRDVTGASLSEIMSY